jgi:hypothetical protein
MAPEAKHSSMVWEAPAVRVVETTVLPVSSMNQPELSSGNARARYKRS